MSCKFVDTNIFIEVFARSGEKSENSKKLLREGKNLITSSLVISEIEWVLRSAYMLDRQAISKYIRLILFSDVEVENKKLLIDVLDYYRNHSVDWTDCLNMFWIKRKKLDEVYSYDDDLSKYDWIKRLEP
jgi:predicted nucleic acid-binding protein